MINDVFVVGTGDGSSVTITQLDGTTGDTLASTATSTTGETVAKRTVIDFGSSTDTYARDGSIVTSTLVPDFLLKLPDSLLLKATETKSLGSNVYEEYIWVLLVNAPGADWESRTVEVHQLVGAQCINAGETFNVDTAGDCDASDDEVVGLDYEQIF